VLKLLTRYTKQIPERSQPDHANHINPANHGSDILLTQIIKLYFELTLIFDVLLSETDYISFPDFFVVCLNRQADEAETAAWQKALHIHQTQRLSPSCDLPQTQNLFSQRYADLETLYPQK